MSEPSRHPITITDLQAITHSGMCDAGVVQWVPASKYEPNYKRAVIAKCTCAAGLIKLMVGGT